MINFNVNERLIERLNAFSDAFKALGFRGRRKKKDGSVCYIKWSLMSFVLQSYYNEGRSHKVSKEDSYFSSVELKEQLGNDYQRIIKICYDVGDNWSGGVAKVYKLKDEVRKIFDDVFVDDICAVWSIDKIGRRNKHFRKNAVDSWVDRKNRIRSRMGGAKFSVNVELNRDNILMGQKIYRELYEEKFYNVPMSDSVKNVLHSLNVDYKRMSHKKIENRLKTMCNMVYRVGLKHSSGNMVTQLYSEKESGRLYNEGMLGLQNVPKDIRYLSMGGLGYYEYDIINCHWELYRQLIRMYGGRVYFSIDEYCKNVTVFRNKVANDIGVSPKILKRLFLSIINGSSKELKDPKVLNKSGTKYIKKDNAIVKDFIDYCGDDKEGRRLANEFVNHKMVSELFDDCRKSWLWLKKQLVYRGNKDKMNGRYKLVNPYGLEKSVYIRRANGKYSTRTKGELISHILQGCESMLLGIVIDKEEKMFVMPHHDGWISKEDIDKKYYKDMLYEKSSAMLNDYDNLDSGFKVEIKSRKLENFAQLKLMI